jgi:hypothetical protein
MTNQKKKDKRACCFEMEDDKPCSRPLYDNEYCIFHSKDIEGKKGDFNDKFWKEFKRQETHEKEYDFKGFVFPGDIFFWKTIFKKKVSFRWAIFYGEANFNGDQFYNEVNFVGAEFYGDVNLVDTKFSEGVCFYKSRFLSESSFIGVHFSGEVNFLEAQFSGYANFFGAQFFAKANFGGAQFSKEANFHDISFSDIYDCIMIDTFFNNVSGLIEFIEENEKKFKKSKKSKKTEFLPGNFSIILGEAATSRYPIISRKIRDDIYLLRFKEKHKNLHFIWWLFADCGRSFFRWALWSLLFSVLFAFFFYNIFYLNDINSFKPDYIYEELPGLSFLYYSVVTFTTLGFGDIVPKPGLLQLIVMLEVILGYIMLGGLISILANKFARRS